MKKILVKYSSEITLKGLNRKTFEDLLIRNIRQRIGKEANIIKESGRIIIENYTDETIEKLRKVFGVLGVAEATVVEKDVEKICEAAVDHMKKINFKTFKVECKRQDKSFPLNSLELSKKVGGAILKNIKDISVDVHDPEVTLMIEIRKDAYIYSNYLEGQGGMPYKSAGKGVLLLSGGIDSPVAGYMLAKRGLELVGVYYHSHPYTSERAKEKVISLAKKLSEYTGSFKLYVVPFTKIQMEIIEKCREDELTIIMRRFMMSIAEEIAKKEGALCLATGESLGQVASQTLESMFVTNSVVSMPVFRPLVGMDKVDIMDIAREIGTYDISILPYEDCCTIFVPKHPKTKPRLQDIEKSEEALDIKALIDDAVNNVEIINI
ncbi:tRNA uracil 4-sulfurtransferase ThiI [Caloramator australicus]|uniref:Probable tRNA sulfurtransferase n=1 Tax=Caloramator australicus RC3 TaxID=857293 RepID=I7J4J4_9CLOT|nr:tRNA uracil 4-sulfurtransferase ThiI [Caloramator australicus]CCJ32656.1 Thiamine biosynthesis protein thiI [Caloramator australicus RC3]